MVLSDRPELWQQLHAWRELNQRIALVPTMGNLHAGHLSLVRLAQEQADRVIVSIFVNPTQFAPNEDFDNYPRTLEQDLQRLASMDVDAVFAPLAASIYPFGLDHSLRLPAPAQLSNILCGDSRPGHFDGVVTVVSRLFNLIQPNLAVFGEKDYQQLLIVERLCHDMGYPIAIIRGPVIRENDGLAMSSRNQYLDAEQRQRAAALNQCLQWIVTHATSGRLVSDLEQAACQQLRERGLTPEYVSIRIAKDLRPVERLSQTLPPLRVLAAAGLGQTRLIDNLPLVVTD